MKKLSIEHIEAVITSQMSNLADAWDSAAKRKDMQRQMSLTDSGMELSMLLDTLKQKARNSGES